MAVRQQQQLEVQHQLLSAREQRLHFLKHGQAGGQTDSERLRRLRERVEAQEQKLRKLRALRGQVDSNKLSNAALTSDLDSIRALFNEKEKELSLAVAKVEELTHQLEELRRGRQNALTGQLPASMELDKLRRELMYRNKLNDQQNMQINQQRETLCQRQEEVNEIDRRISELQERLHRKRLLNQQLANQISVANNKTTSSPPLNQQTLRSSLSNANQHQPNLKPLHANAVKGLNKQAFHRPVESYHLISNNSNNYVDTSTDSEKSMKNYSTSSHQGPVPVNAYLITSAQCQKTHTSDETLVQVQKSMQSDLQQSELRFGTSQDDFHMKLQPQKQVDRFPSHNVNNNVNCINNNIPSSINNNVSIKNNAIQAAILSKSALCNEEKDDYPLEFSGSKSDPKYQTLPYKFSPNSISTSISAPLATPVTSNSKPHKSDTGSVIEETNKGKHNNSQSRGPLPQQNSVTKIPSMDLLNQHQAPFSKLAPITSTSSSIANLQPRVYGMPPLTQSGGMVQRGQPVGGAISTSSSSTASLVSSSSISNSLSTAAVMSNANNTSSNHQKPVSSTAPTSVQHQKPSPIYQTSSTKIHPIQPQVLSSTPQGVLKDMKGEMSPPQSSSTPLSTPDVSSDRGTVGKPALPPKPAVPAKPTPPPRQTQHIPPYLEGSSAWISDSRGGNAPWGMSGQSAENMRPVVEVSSEVLDNNPLRASVSISMRGGSSQQQHSINQTQNQTSQSQADCLNQNSSTYHQILKQDTLRLSQDAQPDDNDSNGSTVSPPPPPTSDPPEEITSFSWRTSMGESQSLKTKSTAMKKPQGADTAKQLNNSGNANALTMINNNISSSNINNININNSNNNSNNNSVHMVSLSRRIEMPPAFLFPENETPPADLIATRDESRTGNSAHQSTSMLESSHGQDETDRIMPVGGSDCNMIDENNRLQHSTDDINKSGSNVNDIETMNNLNNCGPQADESQPVISETKGDSSPMHIVRRTNKKGNLKSGKISVSGSGSRRVSFDPLALLLDASLEGELELVRKTAGQVSNPSAANDEGITALHNAICAGHLDIVKFLVEFGCDVNAQDSDGWTPLHCAASCNNLAMVRFLVEHGACIFATTLSDHETAAEKCEEDEEGFDGCSEYLYSVQEKLGILNNGIVYAVFEYEAHNSDELSFHEGDKLVVLRKGDEWEREWWWSRLNDQEGYIPRNLLGLYPRVQPKKNSE